MNNKSIGTEPVYDARTLGAPRMFILGLQHMFAMFGATVLVPALSGLDVATTLLFAGLGTLLFHVCTKFKVPAFLGSSFAYLGGFSTVATMPAYEGLDPETKLAYALGGIVIAGLLYLVLALLFKVLGAKKVMRYFPPIVTGPMIIMIGLNLSGSAINNASTCWWLALVAMAIIVVANIWGKGMVKIIPILLGVVGSYGVAVICQVTGMHTMDPAKLQALADAPWIGLPFQFEDTLFGLFSRPDLDTGLLLTAAVTIMPLSLATMVEHIGDICAISSTSGTATEVTAFSIITDYSKGIKFPIADFEITPDVAIVDPELTYTMPAKLCAHTGMDALTHSIEAYVSTAGSAYTDANALYAMREIVEWLPKSYAGDKEARQHMHDAQCIAGIAFSSGLLGIVHSMAHKTGAAFTGDHIIHGCANAMYLGKVIQFNSKDARAKSRYAYIAKEVFHLAGETEDELVAALVQMIRDLNDKIDIPQGIKNYGKGGVKADESIIDYAEFEEKKSRIAVDAIGDACTGSNPRQPTPEEMEKLLECVYNDVDVDF